VRTHSLPFSTRCLSREENLSPLFKRNSQFQLRQSRKPRFWFILSRVSMSQLETQPSKKSNRFKVYTAGEITTHMEEWAVWEVPCRDLRPPHTINSNKVWSAALAWEGPWWVAALAWIWELRWWAQAWLEGLVLDKQAISTEVSEVI